MNDTTFLLKSFMRPEITLRAIKSIRSTYRRAKILVVNDSDIGNDFESLMKRLRVDFMRLPYDSGLSAGRNAGVKRITTRYVVHMDDDMIVSHQSRIPEMVGLLEHGEIVCGAMLKRKSPAHWEGHYEFTHDGGLILHQFTGPYEQHGRVRWAYVDFGLNCLASTTEFLRAHPWDEELKLAEHTDYFLRLRGKARVVYTPDCLFEHRKHRPTRYLKMRLRAAREFRLLFFHKHGLRYHIGTNGKRDDWKPQDEKALAALLARGSQ